MSAEDTRKVAELLKDQRLGFLTTTMPDGRLTSRPMALQEVEFDGDLWFFAERTSSVVAQIANRPHVGITLSSNDTWISIDGEAQERSMFQMIRHTHAQAPQHTVVAYSDNASVMEGGEVERWLPESADGAPHYGARRETVHVLMKVEAHKHPNAI